MKNIVNNEIIGRGIGMFSKWTDVLYTNGFHVQHNSQHKKTYRIVDSYNRPYFNGNKNEVFEKIKKIRKYTNKKENILLIHGYANAYTVMLPLKKYIYSKNKNKYNVFDLRYASMHLSLNEIISEVENVIKNLETPTNIIAHSLGGLIAIRLKALYPNKIRKIILIASPINGSLTAKYFDKIKTSKISGPVLKDLIKGVTLSPCELYIINCHTKGIQKSVFLKDENDGVVSLQETLPNIKSNIYTLINSHNAIMKDKKMFKIINDILEL